MARLRLFAAVREKAGVDALDVALAEPLPLRDFLTLASEKAGVALPVIMNNSLLYAINGNVRGLDSPVGPSDEVAVLPPMSGGV
ncbi:MAG: MoaD/ThiS family protein [Nitrospinae bacterium]|nr:MoaD/ThiS family protein [Nitrospinota bacterium]MBF0634496.1 MoaD/ThiS family protein [Nitrospinota bacterium]